MLGDAVVLLYIAALVAALGTILYFWKRWAKSDAASGFAVRFDTLENICRALDCQPGDTLEYRTDEKSAE